jgi:hypothetical protein
MPICPNCRGTIGPREIPCGHCGYDFPPPRERPTQFSVAGLLVLMAAAAGTFAMIRGWGMDGMGLAMIGWGCVLLALQQSWSLPARDELPERLVGMSIYVICSLLFMGYFGIRGGIVVGSLCFIWLFRRNLE